MKDAAGLPEVQKGVLEDIKKFIEDNGYPPTVMEISLIRDCYANAVFESIKALKKKGYLSSDGGKARTLKVL